MSDWFLPAALYSANCVLGGWYILRFLRPNYQKHLTLFLWGMAYFLIQHAAYQLPDSWQPFGEAVSTVFHILGFLILQLIFYEHDIPKQIFIVFSFTAGSGIVRHMAGIFAYLLGELQLDMLSAYMQRSDWTREGVRIREAIYGTVYGVLWLSFYALPFAIYLLLICRRFVRKEYHLKGRETIFLVMPCIASLGITVMLKILLLTVENGASYLIYDKVPSVKFWVPLVCILLLFTIIASVSLFQKLVMYHEENAKRAMLENQIRQMQKEIREIQDIYGDIRGLRHDMRNHLANIMAFVNSQPGWKNDEQAETELKSYIRNMEETIERLDFSYQTGNPITDVILHQKQQEAEKKGIEFAADFIYPSKLRIDAYDIAVVLNNALENAVEACGRTEGGGRIELESYSKGNLFFIEVKNHFTGEIFVDEKTGLPLSKMTKDLPDAPEEQHGLGLSNIQRCARKYKGDMDIAISDAEGRKMFHLTVMMNGKKGM